VVKCCAVRTDERFSKKKIENQKNLEPFQPKEIIYFLIAVDLPQLLDKV
jgi:hypothetical protein